MMQTISIREKGFGKFLKQKIAEGVDKMLSSVKVTAFKMSKSGYKGMVGGSVIIGVFNFQISVGVEVELSEAETELKEEDLCKPGSGILTIQLLDGKELQGTPDVYVSLSSGSSHTRSKMVTQSNAPVFNEVYRLPANVYDNLRVRVYNKKPIGKDERLGEQFFSMQKLASSKPIDIVAKEGLGKGEIRMRVAFRYHNTKQNREIVKH